MELKRYFLVGNKILNREDKIDTFGDTFQWWVDKPIKGSNHGRRFTNFKESDVKKTSDNIFDLVDVGDLIEIKDSPYLHRVYEQIYKGLNNQVLSFIYMTIHTTGQYLLSEVNKDVIISIYKRQTNGDYKKYEVKE